MDLGWILTDGGTYLGMKGQLAALKGQGRRVGPSTPTPHKVLATLKEHSARPPPSLDQNRMQQHTDPKQSAVPQAMHAAFIDAPGTPGKIRYGLLPVPVPGHEELLLRTEVLAVDHVDLPVRSGAYPTRMEFAFIVGRDVVGILAGHRGIQPRAQVLVQFPGPCRPPGKFQRLRPGPGRMRPCLARRGSTHLGRNRSSWCGHRVPGIAA
ncbi:hypothetical protein GCM10025778_04810 [Paeniglutamicibacter antarcticus]|uniref:Alcohol dehydrogenase-like protein n=1 Tax=Paeniglutamicibacter antarcticus TaxID=494023 RepID=A0ABP9THC4_9MICC